MEDIKLSYNTPIALFIGSIAITSIILMIILIELGLVEWVYILLIPILAMPFIVQGQSKHHGEPIIIINETGVTYYRRFLFFKRKPKIYAWKDIKNLELEHWFQDKEDGKLNRYRLHIYKNDGSHHKLTDYYFTVDEVQYKQVAKDIKDFVAYMKS